MTKLARRLLAAVAFFPAILAGAPAHAELSAEELAKIAQNPVGNGTTNGIGDLQISAFLSPAKPGAWIWGVGIITQLPTHSNDLLGNNNAGLGPTAVVLHLEHGSPWVYGVLANSVWSIGSSATPTLSSAAKYNNGLIQPFINYNFKDGAFITSSPLMTVNWEARGSQQWTVPMGIGVGKLFKIGPLPVNTSLSGYYTGEAGFRAELEHSPAGAVDVSEMMKFLSQT